MTRKRPVDGHCRGRRGTVAALMGVSMVMLVGVMAIALDGGMMMAERRKVQAGADAAALATVYALHKGANNGTAQAVGQSYAAANGYNNDGTTSIVPAPNIPPQAGLFAGKAGYAEVNVTSIQPRLFSAIWGAGSMRISTRAVARTTSTTSAASPYGVIVLDPNGSGALTMVGSAQLVSNSGVQVNSSHASAVIANNMGGASTPSIRVNGGYSFASANMHSTQMLTGSSTVTDPLSTLAAPSTTGLPSQSFSTTYGSATIPAGYYPNGISIGGGMNVTMSSGTYLIGSGGFTINNGATVTGSGVSIYLGSGGGGLSFQGGGNITLSAPTSGAYAGVVVYQDRANSTALSIANGTTTTITGTIYAPSAAASFAGGANYNQFGSQYIVKDLNLSNNAYVGINWQAGSVASIGVNSLCLVE